MAIPMKRLAQDTRPVLEANHDADKRSKDERELAKFGKAQRFQVKRTSAQLR